MDPLFWLRVLDASIWIDLAFLAIALLIVYTITIIGAVGRAGAFLCRVQKWEMMPPWYGRAYRRVELDDDICAPAPFHMLVRACWHVKWWILCPTESRLERKMQQLIDAAGRRGYDEGWRDGNRTTIRASVGARRKREMPS